MTSLILRLLGAVAAFGSAVVFFFLGRTLYGPLHDGRLFALRAPEYELIAFLFVPGLILAVVALFWVPPRKVSGPQLPQERQWRTVLVLIFLGAFMAGVFRLIG